VNITRLQIESVQATVPVVFNHMTITVLYQYYRGFLKHSQSELRGQHSESEHVHSICKDNQREDAVASEAHI
jgi:hypothetical protein